MLNPRDAQWSCLTLRVATQSESGLEWLEQRRLAMSPPPAIPGLRARSWRAERRAVTGRYLFDSSAALEAFRCTPDQRDPVLDWLPACGAPTERVDLLPRSAVEETFDRPVFILSAPRAGSTLLYEILVLCDELWSLGREMQAVVDGLPALNVAARGFRSQALDDTDADAGTISTLRACLLAELLCATGQRYLERDPKTRPRRLRFVDKTPENALRVSFLRKMFPDARFVFLYRDLRQNVSSMVEAWQHPGFVAVPDLPDFPRRHWCFLLPDGWRRHSDASYTELAAFQWHAANQAIVDALEAVPREQWTTISYADLLAAPAAEIERLCDFMEVEPGSRLIRALERPLPLSATTISPPSPIKWKSNRSFRPEMVKRLQPLAGRMRNLRVHTAPPVLRSSHQTSVRFCCFVDELEPCPVPPDARVAPSLRVQLGSAVPLGLLPKVRHRERFLSEYPLLWIEDPATGVLCPLWLRHRQAWLCSSLVAGQAPPEALTGRLRDQLHSAGAITTPSMLERRRQHGEELVAAGRGALERDRYCVLPQLLTPVLTAAVSGYYNRIIASGEWPLGDAQVEQRHGWHNERMARFLHGQLVEFMSRLAGRPLKPTYSFASAYRGRAALGAHMDREQCDYTLSLMIDDNADPGSPAWPLWFQAPDGQHRVDLAVSDGVFFRGCELPHWRQAASSAHEQINLLFHFVPSDWAGVMD